MDTVGMKKGISSYSFEKMLRKGAITVEEIPEKAAQLGFGVIDFVDWHIMQSADPFAQAKLLKDKSAAAGLEVGNFAVAGDFLKDGGWEQEADRLKGMVDIAAALGASTMRHDLTYGLPKESGLRSFYDALPILAKGIRAISEYARAKGIRTVSENHGFFMQDSLRLEALMGQVDCDNYGLLIDVGNFACVDEDSALAVSRLASFAFHVHVKDFFIKRGVQPKELLGQGWFRSRGGNFLRGAIIGHGDIPIRQCLGILQAAGYTGTVALEYEGMEDCLTGLSWSSQTLSEMLSSL